PHRTTPTWRRRASSALPIGMLSLVLLDWSGVFHCVETAFRAACFRARITMRAIIRPPTSPDAMAQKTCAARCAIALASETADAGAGVSSCAGSDFPDSEADEPPLAPPSF